MARPVAILDLIKQEIAPFDPPTPNTLPKTKHSVDLMTSCGDIVIRNFPGWRPATILAF